MQGREGECTDTQKWGRKENTQPFLLTALALTAIFSSENESEEILLKTSYRNFKNILENQVVSQDDAKGDVSKKQERKMMKKTELPK